MQRSSRARRTVSRLAVLATSGVLLSLAAAVLPAAAANAAAPSALTLTAATAPNPPRAWIAASATRIAPGARVTLHGGVRVSRAHPSVEVLSRTLGTTRWHTFRRVTATASGAVSVRSAALTTSTQFRLAAQGAPTSTPTTVTVPTSATVTATSPRTPTAGDAVVLAGSTSSQLAGERIFLQLLVGDTWTSVQSSTVFSDATFNVAGLATAGGDQQYRVLVPAARGRAAAASAPVDFTVYAWYRLADLQGTTTPVGDTALTEGLRAVAGTPLEQSWGASIDAGGTASVLVPLENRCTAFRATIGPSADSADGFLGRWRLYADDDVALDQVESTGATGVTADITGASTLWLRSFALSGTGDAVWGNAEVRCSGRP